ncbi:MAG: helix-turn-helix transcriptional regulator [Corynebacteriales bacterium]|nr:helix-turn-helix transcriptional regulator [Mycobacteriales bacterium]
MSYATSGFRIKGDKLRYERKIAGYSIVELARLAGISNGYLSQIERGTRETCAPRTFKRICDSLSLPPEKRQELLTEGQVPA